MTCFSFFAAPVPSDNREAYAEHARLIDSWFMENGALRVVESWGFQVPEGQHTDWRKAVALKEGETVAIGFCEWPDRATCEAIHAKMEADSADDERFDMDKHPMPFDGKRLIYGDFETILDLPG